MSGEALAERTFRLVLEYHGADFEGWQVQSGTRPSRTVQGVLAEAIESITGDPGRIRGAGRTDAGVHAWAQVASIRLATRLEPAALLRALNGKLPRDVAVCAVDAVPDDWDALREAQGKQYRYQIWNGARRSPLRADRWVWVREPLDGDAMREAARAWIGTHDFAAFAAAGSAAKTTVRTLEALEIRGGGHGAGRGAEDAEIVLDVWGGGFLRHMVRNLAGTLIEIGRGRWAPAEAGAILASRDRGEAGPTAPALGLALVAVRDSFSQASSRGRSREGSVDERAPVG